ncbi:hypothetical protein [Nostoc sp.]|uniref:hypothetical protein n=1 Tax=Nostoc sp. TaxID=1180 RepID=UPI002FF95787
MGISFSQDEAKEAIHFGNIQCYRKNPLLFLGIDGDDAPLYLERGIQRVLKKLEELEKLVNEEGEE